MKKGQVILIVDDNLNFVDRMISLLEEEANISHTIVATDFEEARIQLEMEKPTVVLLDINLPGKNGLILARELRQRENIGLIFLTGRDSEVDRILGLEIGADDYLTKPFNPRELLARIRAVMRRKSKELPGAPSQAEGMVEFGPFKFNLATREMRKGEQLLPLTSGEYAVLKVLVSHPREPLSRDKLMNQARGRDYSAMERSIDVQVSRLRRMLEDDAANPRYIQTVWGLGYVFVPDGSVS